MDLNSKLEKILKSKFRSSFRLGEKENTYLKGSDSQVIRDQAFEIIESRIAAANLKNDGHQTPTKGHPVFIAQHATATCCRDCLFKNHGIPNSHHLDQNQIEYVVEIISLWLSRQLSVPPKVSRPHKNKQMSLF